MACRHALCPGCKKAEQEERELEAEARRVHELSRRLMTPEEHTLRW